MFTGNSLCCLVLSMKMLAMKRSVIEKKSQLVNAGGMTVTTASGNMIKGDMINIWFINIAADVFGDGYLIRDSLNKEMFFVEKDSGF